MKTYRILCIDDDPDDIDMLNEAFQSLGVQYELVKAHNGEEGITELRRLHNDGTVPCLIVLDINMPRMDGREAFNAIRKEPAFSAIPVVIFSTSSSQMDKMFFSRKSVEYFVKPIDFNKLSDVASAFLKICENGGTDENIPS